jgi:hypothetical protein
MRLRTLVALSVIALASSARADDAPAAVREALVAQGQALFDSLATGKAEVWASTLADDCVIVDEFGALQTKQDMVGAIRPFPKGMSGSIEIRTPRAHAQGDSVLLDGEAYEQEEVFGQKLVVRYRFLMVFRKIGPGYKLTALTTATIPTPPPPLSVPDLKVDDYPGVYRYGPERAFTVSAAGGKLGFTTRPGAPATALDPVAHDVFMDGGNEKNLILFRRDAAGRVTELIERRKFNDLHMKRESQK